MRETKETANDNFMIDLIEERRTDKKFYRIIIFVLLGIILLQGTFTFGLCLYHNYKWSEFDAVVVDSKDGGNANYIGNDGDVNNYGESSSPQEKEREEQ